jgi:hypothetical protein
VPARQYRMLRQPHRLGEGVSCVSSDETNKPVRLLVI